MPNTPQTPSRFADPENGQTLSEYALLVGLIAIALALVVPALNAPLQSIFTAVASAFGG